MFKKLFVLICVASPIYAADSKSNSDDAEMDLIMQGFEDSTPKKEDDLSDIIQGFENTTPSSNPVVDEVLTTPESPLDIKTLLSLSASYNYQHTKPTSNETDYRGLSRLKLKLQPELRYKYSSNWNSLISANAFYDFAYTINGRDDYTTQVLDSYESEVELREAYIRGTVTSNIDITLGRQIVVWGKADSVRVVDVLNPLDFREPGMVDIEDLRMPSLMAKADLYLSNWNISAIVIPEIRMNKNPAYGSDFYLGDPAVPEPKEEIPEDFDNVEYALALNGQFQGWDLSFHGAYVFDDQAYFQMINNKPVLKHARIALAGVAGNVALGSWILKTEYAFLKGIKFTNFSKTYDRSDVMLGIDYSGITDTTLSIETVARYIQDYDKRLKELPNDTEQVEGQVFFRYTGNFLREKLQVTALISLLGFSVDDGAFYRGSLKYELMEAMSLELGGIVYQYGDSRISKIAASNDRVFMDLRYSF